MLKLKRLAWQGDVSFNKTASKHYKLFIIWSKSNGIAGPLGEKRSGRLFSLSNVTKLAFLYSKSLRKIQKHVMIYIKDIKCKIYLVFNFIKKRIQRLKNEHYSIR